MLPKQYKLPINTFPRESRLIFKDEFVSIRGAFNRLRFNRLGVTFKSKEFKTAVLRNRIRRSIFDFFWKKTDLFKLKTPKALDLLIILNPPIIGLNNKEIEKVCIKYVGHIQRNLI